MKKRYFHEVIEEEEKIISKNTCPKNKVDYIKERQDKEKSVSELLREALKKNNAR